MKTSKLRVIIPLVILGVASLAYVLYFDFGTLSAFGWGTISLICPLGALATIIATKTLIPRVIVVLVLVLALMAVFGRAFCAWLCPTPVVSKLRTAFSAKKPAATSEPKEANLSALTEEETASLSGCKACGACGTKRGNKLDSRHFILIAAIVSTLIFGFPVFCVICPVGLAFASLFLIINLFVDGALTWGVVIVPLILLVEVVFFRKWCSTFCPLGAFMSLMNKPTKTFRPVIDDKKCLEASEGKECGVCGKVCPEGIDLRHPELSETDLCECTRCRECVDHCPGKAIQIKAFAASCGKGADKAAELAEKTEA